VGVDRVKSIHLADFGVAKTCQTLNPNASTVAGTIVFMAPEGDSFLFF